jgi:hypothetical protein
MIVNEITLAFRGEFNKNVDSFSKILIHLRQEKN